MIFGNDLLSFIYIIPILLLSVSIHEFFHSFIAYKLGDRSQKIQGRMTLDPFAHFDLFGFISIMLIGFGWGKPVYVDDSNFKNKNRDNMLVSLAGPLSNFLFAILLTVILKILLVTGLIVDMKGNRIGEVILNMFVLGVQFNVIFSVFNMLPIPPFDGSKVLAYFLPYKYKEKLYSLERYSLIIILVLVISNVHLIIMNPFIAAINNILNYIINL
jgi:Zn-dependent protease